MQKMLTIFATILTIMTVALTTYGGDLALREITTAQAAPISVKPPLARPRPPREDDAPMATNYGDKLFGPTEAPEERVTIDTGDVLEAKEKLDLLLKQNGKTTKVATNLAPLEPLRANV